MSDDLNGSDVVEAALLGAGGSTFSGANVGGGNGAWVGGGGMVAGVGGPGAAGDGLIRVSPATSAPRQPFMPTVPDDAIRIVTPNLSAPVWKLSVYLDHGVVFSYTVGSEHAAREHASAIVATGYRSVSADAPTTLVHYPPHRISKVKIEAPVAFTTTYADAVRGT